MCHILKITIPSYSILFLISDFNLRLLKNHKKNGLRRKRFICESEREKTNIALKSSY